MLLQDLIQGRNRTGMGTNDGCVSGRLVQSILHHFVRDGMREQNHQIRRSDAILHAALELAEHLCLTPVFSADLFISALHTFIAAYNYNAHMHLSFHSGSQNDLSAD